jgi:phage tail-like protein
MSRITAKPQRIDPYKNFKFRVKFAGRYVAGLSKVSALKRSTEVVKRRGSPSSAKEPVAGGKYEPITLERGVTHDAEFAAWANSVRQDVSGPARVPRVDLRQDLVLEVFDETGKPAIVYTIFRCWVSELQALPDLDANANAVTIQHMRLENEGWSRDR